MLGNLIGGFIIIIIGVNLMPTVADQVDLARYNGSDYANPNLTGGASTMVGLVPLFFALGIMSAGVALTAQGLRAAGLLGV
jgi:hypothetical protein